MPTSGLAMGWNTLVSSVYITINDVDHNNEVYWAKNNSLWYAASFEAEAPTYVVSVLFFYEAFDPSPYFALKS